MRMSPTTILGSKIENHDRKRHRRRTLNYMAAGAIIVNIDLQRDIKDVSVLCRNACQYTFYVNMYKHLLESIGFHLHL